MSLSKSKSSTKPNKYAEPYITAAGAAQGPAFEQANAVQKQFQPGLMAAGNYYQDAIGGKFLGGTPHLQGVIDSSNRDITDQVNGSFMNRFGSGYHTNALVRGLSENENRLRYGDYATERGYQDQAAGNIGNLAGQATSLPQLAAGNYAQSIGGLFSPYNTTTQKQGAGGLLAGIAGAGLSGWASGGFKR